MVFWAQGEHRGRGSTLPDSTSYRNLRELRIRESDWLDQWYPPQATLNTKYDHGAEKTRRGSGKDSGLRANSLTESLQKRTSMSQRNHSGRAEDNQQVYSISSAYHLNQDAHLSALRTKARAEDHRGMSLLDRIAKNILTLNSKRGREPNPVLPHACESHACESVQKKPLPARDPTVPSPRNVEGALASPFYDPDFWVLRRPLAPNRIYHFHVIYNHAHSGLERSCDAELALRVTESLVEKLELRGYVNGSVPMFSLPLLLLD